MTAELFAATRADLPDGGRWVELAAGEVITHEPPDAVHGNIVLHLGKALGEYLHGMGSERAGYACFDLGLVVARDPDTIRFPAVAYFVGGGESRFAQIDRELTDVRPELVVEIASGGLRARTMTERVRAYLDWGVGTVWVADTPSRELHIFAKSRSPRTLTSADRLSDDALFPGFEVGVGDLFADPAWWRG